MRLKLFWHKPFVLRNARRGENLIYACDDLESIPLRPGIYVFARRFGQEVIPMYVGQALRLQKRIGSQLNNAQLMMGVKNMENGRRIVLIGEFVSGPGQSVESALDVLEQAHIEYSLAAGYDLLNKIGIKTSVHTIESQGKRGSHKPFPRRVKIKKK